MRILLAIDGSEQSKEAVNNVAGQQFSPNTNIKIVSAYQRSPLITRLEPMGVSEEFYAQTDNLAMKMAEDATESAAEVLRERNPALTIIMAVIDGPPKSVILEEADKFGADLIVVGSHGYGMVERFLLGSISHAVALHARCSVEVVRPRKSAEIGWKILVAIDGSEKSQAVVNDVACQHFPDDSELRVISVVGPTYSPSAYPMEGNYMNVYAEIAESESERCRSSVESAATKLRIENVSNRISISTKVLLGSAKGAILEEADSYEPDLIVVGSHGHGGVERFLLGSVAQAVALHAKCSVKIVRSGKPTSTLLG